MTMAESYRVDCAEKTNRQGAHERISAIGGYHGGGRWVHKQEDAIANIESGKINYYVDRPIGNRVRIIVATLNGRKYLKTESDGEQPNNLLNLPNC
jgi:hypothetical protein